MRALVAFLLLNVFAFNVNAGSSETVQVWRGCGDAKIERSGRGMFVFNVKKLPTQVVADSAIELTDVRPNTEELVVTAARILANLYQRQGKYVCLEGNIYSTQGHRRLVPLALKVPSTF